MDARKWPIQSNQRSVLQPVPIVLVVHLVAFCADLAHTSINGAAMRRCRSLLSPLMTRAASTPALIIVSMLLTTLGVVGVEDAFSAFERNRCRQLNETHKVLTLRGFTGTNHFCADRRLF